MLDEKTRKAWGIPDYSNIPAVALETTIISHGMPYPENVKTALAVEEEVRKTGAIPVTIGIVDGKIKIGMTPEEIEEFEIFGPNWLNRALNIWRNIFKAKMDFVKYSFLTIEEK